MMMKALSCSIVLDVCHWLKSSVIAVNYHTLNHNCLIEIVLLSVNAKTAGKGEDHN